MVAFGVREALSAEQIYWAEMEDGKRQFRQYMAESNVHPAIIVDDIVRAVDPRFVRLTAKWNVRGGIYTDIVAEHRQKGWKAAATIALPPAA